MTSASKLTSSAGKYRVAHSNSSLVDEQSSTPTQFSRLSAPTVPSLSAFMQRESVNKKINSNSDQQLSINTTQSPTRSEVERDQGSPSTSQTEGKLPHKLRRHVSRLRSQVALLSTAPASASVIAISPTSAKSRNASPSPPRPSIAGKRQSRSSKRPSMTSPQYSRQSQQMQRLQEIMKAEASEELRRTSISEERAVSNENPIAFLDLLRPLQNSLSCGSLMSEWQSDSEEDEIDVMGAVTAERGQSRMLRICCSIDNLLLTIGNQVQQEKLDTEIVRGSARELVRLFQFAVKQVVSSILETQSGVKGSVAVGNSPQRLEKESQYALEFFEEIIGRFGKLDNFVRSTLLNEVQRLNSQISELEAECEATKLLNAQLDTEIADLREFHAQNGIVALSLRGPETANGDDDSLALHLTSGSNQRDGGPTAELEQLKKQCDEYARVLDMAKQEIRISHHERDVHKAHVAELTSSLFKDTELGSLRNQLQSEKKRVKILEAENVALLECKHDQSLKIQSLLANKTSPINTGATNNQLPETATNIQVKHPNTTKPASQLSVDSPVELNVSACGDKSSLQPDVQHSTETTTENVVRHAHGTTGHWFRRIMEKSKDVATMEVNNSASAIRLRSILATLPINAIEQTNSKRLVGIPAIAPTSLGARVASARTPRPTTAQRKRKLKSIAVDGGSPDIVSNAELAHSCRCLIWYFFQQLMMAQEANELLAGSPINGCGTPAPSTPHVTLELIVYHFFLERGASDKAALADAVDFIQCLQVCRSCSFEVEIFCQFLEGRRSHDQLNFFLWGLEAIQSTEVGVSYDDPMSLAPSTAATAKQDEAKQERRYVCSLKAMFVVRAVFRLLRVKTSGTTHPRLASSERAQSRPSTAPSRSSSSSNILKPSSPLSPSRRKLRSQPSTNLIGDNSNAEQHFSSASVVDRAILSLRVAVEANGGRPITLEVFSQILGQFSELTSHDELHARLGPFYIPTNDERKVPWEVLIALLLELYQHQIEWQRKQFRSLFMHLHWQRDIDEQAAAKKKAEELALLEAATKKRAGSKKQDSPQKQQKRKRRTNRQTAAHGSSVHPEAKYLFGLSRSILKHLLVASALFEDEAYIDIDWLFVRILDVSNCTADDIHFDAVYDALRVLRILPDWSKRLKSTIAHDQESTKDLAAIVNGLHKHWQIVSATSLGVLENDLNVFVRKYVRQCRNRINAGMVLAASPEVSTNDLLLNIDSIRALLLFAWRLGSKRTLDVFLLQSSKQVVSAATCLSEFYFANLTVRAASDPLQGYSASVVAPEHQDYKLRDSLSCFYSTKGMHIESHLIIFASKAIEGARATQKSTSPTTGVIVNQIQHVLQRYAVHLAYLFNRYMAVPISESPRVSLDQWRQLTYEIALIHPFYLTLQHHHELFLRVASGVCVQVQSNDAPVRMIDEPAVNASQFSELFVVIAFDLFRRVQRKLKNHRASVFFATSVGSGDAGRRFEDIWKPLFDNDSSEVNPALVVALFLHEVLAKNVFQDVVTTHEMSFSHKLTCPLVMRALLEHRAFLRSVFFYYAKQDEDAADLAAGIAPDSDLNAANAFNQEDGIRAGNTTSETSSLRFQLEKTKRNSMSFDEFQMFLREFQLLRDLENLRSSEMLCVEDAQLVFRNVMAVDNEDVDQLEFDEFTGAVVALAVYFTPDPFTLWHEKINMFVSSLKLKLPQDDVRLQY